MKIELPDVLLPLLEAQRGLQAHFADTNLAFTLDGKLVGDIGEAIAAEAFGLKLCRKRTPGVDAYTQDRDSVQIKATGKKNAGPAFTPGKGTAKYLLFLRIDFPSRVAEVGYNGLEAPVRALLPTSWTGTKRIPLARVLELNGEVADHLRLPRVRSQGRRTKY